MKPVAIVIAFLGVAATLVIFAVASSPDDEPTAAPTTATEAPTTTTVAAAADAATNEQIYAQAIEVLGAPTIESVAALAIAMGETGDPAWVPYLVDMLRMYGAGGVVEPIALSLATLTGEPIPDNVRLIYATYGRWMHREEPLPVDLAIGVQGYIAWKSLLYSQVDLEFAESRGRSMAFLIASRKCADSRRKDSEQTIARSKPTTHIRRIAQHCQKQDDYLPPDTPLKEAIFRVLLTAGSEPKTPQDISKVLSERWALTAYPRDVSETVIQRLLDHSESYCIARVPEPEPSDGEEPAPQADTAGDSE